MIHIHPFPARMAPEIALKGLEVLPANFTVLDPMSGSGMVLGTASKLGLNSLGFDLDPLACLISRANATAVNADRVRAACERLVLLAQSSSIDPLDLPWVDEETRDYIDFWFAPKQIEQLSALSHLLIVDPVATNPAVLNALKIAFSRLIVTKEPKASLARDTAHSRPHRTITENSFDVFEALPASLNHVLKALNPESVLAKTTVYRGDARKMKRLSDETVDFILTSPPYLNAIDYMRGHRLSLVWMGYTIAQLRKIRARSVGAEVVSKRRRLEDEETLFSDLSEQVDERKRRMLLNYFYDLCSITSEAHRVLKKGRSATYVVGNSNIRGNEIPNSEFLILAAERAGFTLAGRSVREIPENRRYMPLKNSEASSLSKRMRTEHVITLNKASVPN